MRGAARRAPGAHAEHKNFYSRASCEARLFSAEFLIVPNLFLLTRLMRGAALQPRRHTQKLKISTHAPHARRGDVRSPYKWSRAYFYSRASCEARQLFTQIVLNHFIFLLTRLMRGAASTVAMVNLLVEKFLLTRLMRGAAQNAKQNISRHSISTHAPHARRGPDVMLITLSPGKFLLTRLMRGAAQRFAPWRSALRFLLTRLMRGAAV